MPTYTIEELFKQQLEKAEPLTEDSPQIKNERTDYFGDRFIPGDYQLFILVVRGKISGIQDTEIEVTNITPRSFDKLFEEYVYEPQWDSKEHKPLETALPRFVQKPIPPKKVDTDE